MSNWISVNDRLPPDYVWVLVSVVDSINPKYRFVPSVGKLVDGKWSTKESDEFFNSNERLYSKDYESVFRVKVTHWMPLPEAPK
jgi:hypothetical protein